MKPLDVIFVPLLFMWVGWIYTNEVDIQLFGFGFLLIDVTDYMVVSEFYRVFCWLSTWYIIVLERLFFLFYE